MEGLYDIASKNGVCDVEVKLLTPTYLRALSLSNTLLVHKKSKFPRLSVPSHSLELEDSFIDAGDGELNLTGAPLECGLEFDDSVCNSSGLVPRLWQNDETLHIPLTFKQASAILTEYNLSAAENQPLGATVWVVCDGSDARRLVLMGSHVDADRLWFSRSFVTLQDDVCRKDIQSFAETTVKRHCSFAGMPEDEVRYEVTCTYEVFGARNAGEGPHCARNVEQHASVVLETTWENTSFRRSVTKPPLEAVTVLDLLVTVGQDTSETYPLWQQLSLLRRLSEAISRGGEAAMPPDGVPVSGGEGTVCSRVRELLATGDGSASDQWRGGDQADRDNKPAADLAEMVTDIATRGRTQRLDLTHALWRLTMRCKSVEDLVACLTMVFEEVKSGHFVPYIDPENTSRVATELIALRSGAALPSLTGWTPLEMLLEMGLESLERDYLHVLLASRVASFAQLGFEPGRDRLSWLHRTHCLVECLLATQCHLDLPPRSLYPLVGALAGAETLQGRAVAFRHVVRTVDVAYRLDTAEFSAWRLRVTSEGRGRRAATVALCSALPVFPPHLVAHDGNGTDESFQDVETRDSSSFYCVELKTIANKLG